jgi:hypothetical protein
VLTAPLLWSMLGELIPPINPMRILPHAAVAWGQLALATPVVQLSWPEALGGSPDRTDAHELIERLLPEAQRGLDLAGVDRDDSAPLLACFERRTRTGATGAAWQLRNLARAEARRPRDEALAWMLQHYLERSEAGLPVDAWSDAPL